MTQSMPLLAASHITTNEANVLFYKGIPCSMHNKIRRKIPEAHWTAMSAPLITNAIGYLMD